MDSKRVVLTILVFSLIAVFTLSLVMAVKMPKGWKMDVEEASFDDNNSSNETIGNNTSHEHHENESENETHHGHNETRNMTYGRCVSNESKIKNTCFLTAKVKKFDCILSVKNQTELNKTLIKESLAQCRQVYKEEKKQCKVGFKAAKEECRQYKRNFLQEII